MNRIELKLVISKRSKVFSGRDEGERMRKILKLDFRDNDGNTYLITVPDVYSLNASYFLGCFSKSIKNIGESSFREKYKFKTPNDIISINIEDGITRAVRSLR